MAAREIPKRRAKSAALRLGSAARRALYRAAVGTRCGRSGVFGVKRFANFELNETRRDSSLLGSPFLKVDVGCARSRHTRRRDAAIFDKQPWSDHRPISVTLR